MKTNGKNICKELKAIRRQVAEQNDIPLEQPECTYDGPCDGTCPHCDAELQYIEKMLNERTKLGKVATVAGVALTMAALSSCSSTQQPIDRLQGEPPIEQPRPAEPEPLGGKVPEMPDGTVVDPREQLRINDRHEEPRPLMGDVPFVPDTNRIEKQ
ncbi:MAG: hypothetical protein IJ634_02700 [Bacteroidales bacterium]|nr:hypothetical protein [Bacteroidales bacterium]